MIQDHDRSGWFGASDTYRIMSDWNTKSFQNFWLVKLGLRTENYTNEAMMAGTAYEHPILDFIGAAEKDRQIKKRKLRLRVNLDGEDDNYVYEVKTYSSPIFRLSRAYWMQAQVEMFAAKKPLQIVSYRMTDAEYKNYMIPIDRSRLGFHPVNYDELWVKGEYLPRLEYLAECLKKGVSP